MTYHYQTKRTCSRAITFDIDNDRVYNVRFDGGCSGNTQGVSRLVEGRPTAEVITLLQGIDCRGRGTSCPDQLSKALQQALEDL